MARAEAEGIPETMAEPACFVLEGGIKGWVAGGPAFRNLVDGYEESHWMQFDEVKAALTAEKSATSQNESAGGKTDG